MIDNKYFQFGKSLASVQLMMALEDAPSGTRKKIITHIQTFCLGLNGIDHIPGVCGQRTMARLWMENCINHQLKFDNFPDFNFDSTMKNVIKYRYRLWLEGNDGCMNKRELLDRKRKNINQLAKAEAWIKLCKNIISDDQN